MFTSQFEDVNWAKVNEAFELAESLGVWSQAAQRSEISRALGNAAAARMDSETFMDAGPEMGTLMQLAAQGETPFSNIWEIPVQTDYEAIASVGVALADGLKREVSFSVNGRSMPFRPGVSVDKTLSDYFNSIGRIENMVGSVRFQLHERQTGVSLPLANDSAVVVGLAIHMGQEVLWQVRERGHDVECQVKPSDTARDVALQIQGQCDRLESGGGVE